MKIFGYELRKASQDVEQREYNPYASGMLPFGVAGNSNPNMNLSAVYRATEIISDSVAMLPIYITDKKSNELEGHRLNFIFEQSTGLLNYYTFMKLLIQSVILKGNGYAYIHRDGNGQAKSLQFLETGVVTLVYNKQRQELYYNCAQVKSGKIPPRDMIHLKKNSWDGVNGVSVLAYAKRTLEIAHNTEDSANSFFSNGCNLGGIISYKGNMTSQQKEDLKKNWLQAYGGTDTHGCVLGVMGGDLTYQPIQVNSADAQMLESRVFNVKDIARFFGISPIMLGDYSEGNSYNSIEAIQQQFLLHTLQPYVGMVEQEFTRKLADYNVKVNLNESILLRNDKSAQANYFGTLIDKGILSINEARIELGYPEVEGGDEHHINFTDTSKTAINKEGDANQHINESGKENEENPQDNSLKQEKEKNE